MLTPWKSNIFYEISETILFFLAILERWKKFGSIEPTVVLALRFGLFVWLPLHIACQFLATGSVMFPGAQHVRIEPPTARWCGGSMARWCGGQRAVVRVPAEATTDWQSEAAYRIARCPLPVASCKSDLWAAATAQRQQQHHSSNISTCAPSAFPILSATFFSKCNYCVCATQVLGNKFFEK